MGSDTFVWGSLKLRAYAEEGIVTKVEHWSETHVSGYVDAPYVFSGTDGHVRSTGGSGAIGSRVRNWSRFYMDVGEGRESVVQMPAEFAAREGHRLRMSFVDTGPWRHVITATNVNTGAIHKNRYDGADLIGNAWLVRLFILLTAGAALYGVIGVYPQLPVYPDQTVALLWSYFLPMLVFGAAGWLLTLPFRLRRRAVRRFIAKAQTL